MNKFERDIKDSIDSGWKSGRKYAIQRYRQRATFSAGLVAAIGLAIYGGVFDKNSSDLGTGIELKPNPLASFTPSNQDGYQIVIMQGGTVTADLRQDVNKNGPNTITIGPMPETTPKSATPPPSRSGR